MKLKHFSINIKPPPIFSFICFITITLLFVTCKKDKYQRVDFTPMVIDSIVKISLDSVRVYGEVKEVEKITDRVHSYGLIWTTSAENETLDVSLFENTLRIGALNGDEPNGRFDAVLNVVAGISYHFATYASPDNDRFFYSDILTYSTGTGAVFTDPVYYEGNFKYEMKAHLTGIEKGLTVVQHGFCWSLTDEDPRFDADTVQLGPFENEIDFSFKHLHFADSTAEINPHYIRSYAVFRNSIGQEETVFGAVTIFDGDFNFWTPIAPYPGGGRSAASCFVLEGKAYIGAGWKGGGAVFDDFWVYDPDFGWEQNPYNFTLGTPPIAGMGFAIKGKGYLGIGNGLGGSNSNIWEFDPHPDSTTWKPGGPLFPGGGSAPIAGVGFSINDSLGYFGTGKPAGVLNRSFFFQYNPATNEWSELNELASFGGGERSETTGFAIGDKGYLGFGGIADIWEYDPSNNTWTEKAAFPGPWKIRNFTIGFELNGKGYIGTGKNSVTGEHLNDFWEFDPNDDSDGFDENGNPIGKWTRRADLPIAFIDGVGFSIGQKGYAGLGSFSGDFMPIIWEYNP